MDISYSFIIPHHNSVKLLGRCLRSIPRRDDIQIIVVDDCSDNVDWDSLDMNLNRIQLIKNPVNKGGGAARNIGLDYAVGKWIIFADSDDIFVDNFLSILDKYKDSSYDVVYYNFEVKYSDDLNLDVKQYKKLVDYYTNYDGSDEMAHNIRFKILAPWNKMISKKYIDAYNFRFEEVSITNDAFFGFIVSYFTSNTLITKENVYIYTYNRNSITTKKYTDGVIIQSLKNIYKWNVFYSHVHFEHRSTLLHFLISTLYRRGIKEFFRIIKIYMSKKNDIVLNQDILIGLFENYKKRTQSLNL